MKKPWSRKKLEDLTTKIGSGSTPRGGEAVYKSEGTPLIRSMNVHFHGFKADGLAYLDPTEAQKLDHVKVLPGDVLLNITGASIGRVTTAPEQLGGARVNQHVCIIRPTQEVDSKFLAQYLASPDEQARVMNVQVGATRQALTRAMILRWEVPVPHITEQREIVAEIEKQFTRLDAGVAALKRVKANLKRYRAAVLKAACEGRLVPTEAELTKGRNQKSKFETGQELLTRILNERRQHWQGRGTYKEPAAPDIRNLPQFPSTWIVASLEQLTSAARPICYGILMPKENVATGILFVKVKDMKGDKIDLESLHRTTPEIAAKYARASLKTGDLLLAIRGTYGRVAEVSMELDGGNITQDTARLDVTKLVNHRFVATCLRNPDCQNYFKRVARGVAVKGVNIGDVRPTPIPLPPLAEQTRIVAEVEHRLSVVEELESVVAANLQRAARLRQAVLQRAFWRDSKHA